MKKAHSKRRRNRKLFARINRTQEMEADNSERRESRKIVFNWPLEKKRRWCEKYG